MITVAIYIKDVDTLDYNRIDLFDDEKISVTSSIQNINDISKTFTDFSQTFTVPASKQNNKIFRHWYDNSNDVPFSTLVKSDAYIEIDTITFRKGKIQLESANLEDGQAKDYSITFIGILGNLKDKFAGKFLKDLILNTTYDYFNYTPANVLSRITTATSSDIMFPLISSDRYWNYGSAVDLVNDINSSTYPIRYNELFPALKLRAVLNIIETEFGINFDGTATEPSNFINTDLRFTNSYLYMKNAETFVAIKNQTKNDFTTESATNLTGFDIDLATDKLLINFIPSSIVVSSVTYNLQARSARISITTSTPGIVFTLSVFKNGKKIYESAEETSTVSGLFFNGGIYLGSDNNSSTDYYEFYVNTTASMTFTSFFSAQAIYIDSIGNQIYRYYTANGVAQTTPTYFLPIKSYFPEIKVEDFFSGLLKMFNLTCFSSDGINYTVEQLETYYGNGNDVDITKYVIQDKKALNRVKTYKKINFEYEKSESLVNVGFNSANGVEYGSLLYNTNNDGDEYFIKLPFEDLNFNNLQDKLQVGYALKTDLQKYTPKPIILYDYDPTALTTLTSTNFKFSTALTGSGSNTTVTAYKAFGQETLISGLTYGLNFGTQESTLTNEIIENGLYKQYYENYFNNIFNFKARLVKVSAILPTSVLTTLKLNDNVIIRDTKYLINTFTTDLTTGEVQFELLTDQRL